MTQDEFNKPNDPDDDSVPEVSNVEGLSQGDPESEGQGESAPLNSRRQQAAHRRHSQNRPLLLVV